MNYDYAYSIIWLETQRLRKHQQQTKAAAKFLQGMYS